MIKYGVPAADWIRKLGKRMLKFDFKGYSKAKQWVRDRRGRRGLAGGAEGARRGRLRRLGDGRGRRRRRGPLEEGSRRWTRCWGCKAEQNSRPQSRGGLTRRIHFPKHFQRFHTFWANPKIECYFSRGRAVTGQSPAMLAQWLRPRPENRSRKLPPPRRLA